MRRRVRLRVPVDLVRAARARVDGHARVRLRGVVDELDVHVHAVAVGQDLAAVVVLVDALERVVLDAGEVVGTDARLPVQLDLHVDLGERAVVVVGEPVGVVVALAGVAVGRAVRVRHRAPVTVDHLVHARVVDVAPRSERLLLLLLVELLELRLRPVVLGPLADARDAVDPLLQRRRVLDLGGLLGRIPRDGVGVVGHLGLAARGRRFLAGGARGRGGLGARGVRLDDVREPALEALARGVAEARAEVRRAAERGGDDPAGLGAEALAGRATRACRRRS